MRRKLNEGQERLWKAFIFLVRLLPLSIPLYLILWLNVSMLPMQRAVADQTVWILRALGFDATESSLIISVGAVDPFIFYIGEDCTGWKSMIFYFALILATLGTGTRKRLLGLAIGIPLIYLGNLLRIIAVVFVEEAFGYDAAMWIHDWLWQAGLMALVLGLWLIWLELDYLKGKADSIIKPNKRRKSGKMRSKNRL